MKEPKPKTDDSRPTPEINTGDGMTIDSTSSAGGFSDYEYRITWRQGGENASCTYELRLMHEGRVLLHLDDLTEPECLFQGADVRSIVRRLEERLPNFWTQDSLNLNVCVLTHCNDRGTRVRGTTMATASLEIRIDRSDAARTIA